MNDRLVVMCCQLNVIVVMQRANLVFRRTKKCAKSSIERFTHRNAVQYWRKTIGKIALRNRNEPDRSMAIINISGLRRDFLYDSKFSRYRVRQIIRLKGSQSVDRFSPIDRRNQSLWLIEKRSTISEMPCDMKVLKRCIRQKINAQCAQAHGCKRSLCVLFKEFSVFKFHKLHRTEFFFEEILVSRSNFNQRPPTSAAENSSTDRSLIRNLLLFIYFRNWKAIENIIALVIFQRF